MFKEKAADPKGLTLYFLITFICIRQKKLRKDGADYESLYSKSVPACVRANFAFCIVRFEF